MNTSIDGNDLAAVYDAAQRKFYEGKRVGWDNWPEIADTAHKYALIAVASSIIDRVRGVVIEGSKDA